MINKPLISVISPTYNHERFIGQCIESVLSQTYSNLELIIIDDASDDQTPNIINNFVRKDKRIKFIKHEENWGIYRLAYTYNQALESAQGELIGILEGDDFWPPDKLENQYTDFKNEELVLSWGKAAFTDELGNLLGIRPRKTMNKNMASNKPRGIILKSLLYRNIIPPVSVLLRKQTLLSIGGFQHRPYLPYVDYPTFLLLSLQGEFCFVKIVTGYWRKHKEQATLKYNEELAKGASKFSQEFVRFIPNEIKSKYNLSPDKILKREKARIAFSYLFEARVSLSRHKWKDARQSFKIVLKQAPFFLKVISLLCLVMSYFNIDLSRSSKYMKKIFII